VFDERLGRFGDERMRELFEVLEVAVPCRRYLIVEVTPVIDHL
jgi:hypothetical protein